MISITAFTCEAGSGLDEGDVDNKEEEQDSDS